MKKMNPSNSVTPSVPPSFRGELYFLMAKFLENGPCTETAARLKIELTEKSLLQPRYDWKGIAHAKTFRDMEEEFDPSGTYFIRILTFWYKQIIIFVIDSRYTFSDIMILCF